MSPSPISPLRKWLGLLVTSFALAIIIIDTTVLNVSLRDIMRDLNTDLQMMQWIITVYSLVLAALTITGGRLGDLFGRKRMFVLGAFLFGVGSLIASISTSPAMLLFGWSIVEGIGAALMMPATASMLVATFHDKERAIAFGVWGGVAGAASAFGPLFGGYLTSNYSWHWAFRINVGIVLLVMIGSVLIKESIDKKEAHTLDIMGSILSALSMAAIVYGIVESSTYGWWEAKKIWTIGEFAVDFGKWSVTPVAIAFGLALLLLFIFWEYYVKTRGKTPLVSLRIFKNKQFVAGILVTALMALGQAGIIFALPVYFQIVGTLSAFETGKMLLPLSLSLLVVAPLSGLLRRRIKTRDLIQAGLIISVIGVYIISTTLSISAVPTDFWLGLVVLGVGMGLTSSQIANVTLSAVDPNIAGEASGINNTTRQLGSSLGSALIGAVFLTTIATSTISGIRESSVIPEQFKGALEQQVNNQTDHQGAVSGQGAIANKLVGQEIQLITNKATVDGSKQGLIYTIYFTLAGVLVTFLLPREMREREDKIAHGVSAH